MNNASNGNAGPQPSIASGGPRDWRGWPALSGSRRPPPPPRRPHLPPGRGRRLPGPPPVAVGPGPPLSASPRQPSGPGRRSPPARAARRRAARPPPPDRSSLAAPGNRQPSVRRRHASPASGPPFPAPPLPVPGGCRGGRVPRPPDGGRARSGPPLPARPGDSPHPPLHAAPRPPSERRMGRRWPRRRARSRRGAALRRVPAGGEELGGHRPVEAGRLSSGSPP